MMIRFPTAAVLFVLCALGRSPEARGQDLDSFTGSFSGTGTVVEGPNATEREVRCRFNSSRQGGSGLALRGTCWAYAIMSRSISADLVFNSKTGRVVGTYAGARVGPARLSGRRRGSALDLVVNWPKPVHGSMTARMRIERSGPERLRILVLSRVGEDSPVRPTTDLVLHRP
jgi:hypothetical protein